MPLCKKKDFLKIYIFLVLSQKLIFMIPHVVKFTTCHILEKQYVNVIVEKLIFEKLLMTQKLIECFNLNK